MVEGTAIQTVDDEGQKEIEKGGGRRGREVQKREQEGNGREIKGERDKQGVKVCVRSMEIHG